MPALPGRYEAIRAMKPALGNNKAPGLVTEHSHPPPGRAVAQGGGETMSIRGRWFPFWEPIHARTRT